MSDEFRWPSDGFPILFVHEDPDEKRQRIEGAQPPPESVRVPRLLGSAEPQPDVLEYALLNFPWEPWSQGTETQSLTRQYADWLNEIGPARLAEFRSLLEEAGAPVVESTDLAALGAWVQDWLSTLAVPFIRQGFIEVERIDRLGSAWVAPSPHHQGYSRSLDALIGSLAHDLALVVAGAAQLERADLTWQPAFDTYRQRFVLAMSADAQPFNLIEHLVEYIVQSAARPRGAQGRALRRWYALTLQRSCDALVNNTNVTPAYEAFPDIRSSLSYPRRSVSRPQRSDRPADANLIAAAEKFQRAGWFESVKLSPADLARAAQAAWRRYEGEDITSDSAQMYVRMLLLDGGRTWSEDAEAGIQPGDGVYGAIAESLSHAGLKAIRGLDSTEEDWTSAPGDLLLTLLAQRGKPQIFIPSPAPYISAALFTGLNELLTDEGPRLWFFDHDSRLGIVTRATQAERDALLNLTGIRLDRDPPAWWTALAPIPRYPARPKPDRAAAGRPKPANVPVSSRRSKPATAQRGGRDDAAPDSPTAQQEFTRMMRNLIAPALRDLGFKGSVTRGFSCRNGDYSGSFWTQKSRWSTKAEVMFWVHLSAAHEPTHSPYWNWRLHALIPGNESFSRWTVRAGQPVEPIAEHLLGVFRSYGWPAIQAALDSPGYPPDPAVTWARSFEAEPTPAARRASGPNLGPLTWLVHRAAHEDDDVFADLADPDDFVRMEAAVAIGLEGLRDARAVPALLNRLEFDPSASVRERAALALGRAAAAHRAEVREAFLAAAAQDEDVQVRWAARYGLRLAAKAGAHSGDGESAR